MAAEKNMSEQKADGINEREVDVHATSQPPPETRMQRYERHQVLVNRITMAVLGEYNPKSNQKERREELRQRLNALLEEFDDVFNRE